MVLAYLLAACLLLVFPVWDRWETSRLREAARHDAKSASYLRIIAGLWLFALAALVVFPLSRLLRAPFPPGSFGSGLPPSATWIVVIAATSGIVLPVVIAWFHRGVRARMVAAVEEIAYLLPRSPREELLFAGVAVTAGIAEELIYRGFLLRYLAADPWGLSALPALAVSSAVFGLAHAGQGARGVLLTSVVGAAMGGLFLASGSLLPSILLHTLIDLRALAVAHLARREREAPADRTPSPPEDR
jgi:membrane protease YdiL (CAAX protease family)